MNTVPEYEHKPFRQRPVRLGEYGAIAHRQRGTFVTLTDPEKKRKKMFAHCISYFYFVG